MKILLVTINENLETILRDYLNPANEYCGIVVDEIIPAKQIIKNFGLSEKIIYPLYDIKECIENLEYDYILCVSNKLTVDLLSGQVRKYGAPKDKFIHFYLAFDSNHPHIVKRALKYFEKYGENFEIFATGMSYISHGLDSTRFKKKLFNFAKASQDLYYDYQIAKFAVKHGKNLHYALIGLAPYSFYFDLSKSTNESWRIIMYILALNDAHNFCLSSDKCRQLFIEEFLDFEIPTETLDLNNVNHDKIEMQTMNLGARIETRDRSEIWSNKKRLFRDTYAENIKIFDDYLTLCEEKSIIPIIFLPPMSEGYMKHFNKEILKDFHQVILESVKKHPSALFVNGWQIREFSDVDFFNADHLNRLGAAKLSVILNNIIEQIKF